MKLDRYAKAIVAALITGYGMYQAAKGIQTAAGEGIAFDEWVNIIFAALAAGFGVWAVPNAKPAPVAGETPAKPIHVELEPSEPFVGRRRVE